MPLVLSPSPQPLPSSYKAIVLFTPGGDFVYCIDPDKKQHWHIDLCIALREILNLSEPPHFLTPSYTATLDCWIDPRTQQTHVLAEAYPTTFPYRHFLNALFQLPGLVWKCLPWPQGLGDPLVLSIYRKTFPQLWQNHDLILRLDQLPTVRRQEWRSKQWNEKQIPGHFSSSSGTGTSLLRGKPSSGYTQELTEGELRSDELLANFECAPQFPGASGYAFRLFVAGHGPKTEQILQQLYQLLEQNLGVSYTLKVIDVLKHPDQAEKDQVTAIPTLVRVWPQPTHRIVGEFEQFEQLMQVLRLPEVALAAPPQPFYG